jgi:predicted  nucleic acid-binding Zn-ribbon protein
MVESLQMDENRSDTAEQVVTFLPKELSRSHGTPPEEPGQAIIAKIRKAADLSNETCDRAMALAHKLAMQLRAAEDQIRRLEGEVALFRERAARAEAWLQTIHKEIEEKLVAPRSSSGPEQKLMHELSDSPGRSTG